MLGERFIVTVKKWEKYNPRTDVKKSSWFRFEHSFFDSSRFFGLSAAQKLCWIYVLCEVSKNQTDRPGSTTISTTHATTFLALSVNELYHTLKIFEEFQLLEIRTLRGRYVHVENPCLTIRNDTGRDGTIRDETRRNDVPETTHEPGFENDPDQPPLLEVQPTRKPHVPKRPVATGVNEFIAAYCEAIKTKHGISPAMKGKNAGIAKRLVEVLGKDQAIALIEPYLRYPDRLVVDGKHPLNLLELKLQAVQAFALSGEGPKIMTAAQSREQNLKQLLDKRRNQNAT